MSGTDGRECMEVSEFCPVEASIYGYYPSRPANYYFTLAFGMILIVQLFQGIKWKTRSYLIAMGFGCLGECIGYVGRILLHDNPFDDVGFNIQICCLIIAPVRISESRGERDSAMADSIQAFLAAAIYLTLKHVVLTVGEQYSRLPAKYYTWIFILCDLFSLILQGAGGGLAATADTDSSAATGNNLMMAGIVFQVFTLLVFGVLAGEYASRAYQRRSEWSQSVVNLVSSMRFKLFVGSLLTAYTVIFIRCVYRIAEMAGGWRNEIMQNEAEFIALDGVMCLIAALCLTVFHPGYSFPPMQMRNKHTTGGEVAMSKLGADTPPTVTA